MKEAKEMKVLKERKIVVNAMGFSASSGHWIEHSCGYLYVTANCGGAVTTAACPQCGGTLSGSNYTLNLPSRRLGDGEFLTTGVSLMDEATL